MSELWRDKVLLPKMAAPLSRWVARFGYSAAVQIALLYPLVASASVAGLTGNLLGAASVCFICGLALGFYVTRGDERGAFLLKFGGLTLTLLWVPGLLAVFVASLLGDEISLNGLVSALPYLVVLLGSVALSESTGLNRSLQRTVPMLWLAFILLWIVSGRPQQFTGFANHKNVVGGVLLFSYLLWQMLRHRSGANPSSSFAALLVLGGCFAASSRTAMVLVVGAWVLSTVWFDWSSHRRRRFSRVAVAAVPTAPFAYVLFGQLPIVPVVDGVLLRTTGTGLYTGRLRIWTESFSDALSSPLIGDGVHFVEVYSAKSLYSHNAILATLSFSGFLGGLCLLWFLWKLADFFQQNVYVCFFLVFFAAHQTFEANFLSGGFPIGSMLTATFGSAIGITRAVEASALRRTEETRIECTPTG